MSMKRYVSSDIPKSCDLKYFIGNIDQNEIKNGKLTNEFQWQILQTRYLIWKYKELLAAPMPGYAMHIYLVVSGSDIENGKFFEAIKGHGIALSGPFGLTNAIYQACITYSFSFRLSPTWNKICDTWIHSPDFLTSIIPQPAITWEPIVTEGALHCSLEALRVRIPLLDVKDYDLNFEELRVKGIAPMSGLAYVLPQMKQCSLISVQTTIPPSCPLSNYEIMRKHWKNNYGFRLPHDDTGMLYIQVSFRWNKELYTYPSICVRSSKQQKLPARNGDEIISAFVQHMVEKCQTVCGKPLAFTLFQNTTTSLQPSQAPNFTEELPRRLLLGLKPLQTPLTQLLQKEDNCSARNSTAKPLSNIVNTYLTDYKIGHEKGKFIPTFKPRRMTKVTISDEFQKSKTTLMNENNTNNEESKTEKVTKIVPQFKPKYSQTKIENFVTTINKGKVSDKSVGSDGNKLIKEAKSRAKNLSTPKKTLVGVKMKNNLPNINRSTDKNLTKKHKQLDNLPLSISTSATLSTTDKEKSIRDVQGNVLINDLPESSLVFKEVNFGFLNTDIKEDNQHAKCVPPKVEIIAPIASLTKQEANLVIVNKFQSQPSFQLVVPNDKTMPNNESLELLLQLPISEKTHPLPVGNEKKVKRPNPKPCDVESLAKAKLLSKANMSSLREFCKAHNIRGYSKDKKEALMQKVYNYYQIPFQISEALLDTLPQSESLSTNDISLCVNTC